MSPAFAHVCVYATLVCAHAIMKPVGNFLEVNRTVKQEQDQTLSSIVNAQLQAVLEENQAAVQEVLAENSVFVAEETAPKSAYFGNMFRLGTNRNIAEVPATATPELSVPEDPVWPPAMPLGGPVLVNASSESSEAEAKVAPKAEAKSQTAPQANGQSQAAPLQATPPTLNWHMIDRFIVLPEYNLLFCYIEKVACTAFNDVFSQLRKRHDPKIIRTQGNKGWFQNSPYYRWYTKHDLEKILVNRSWHKAVFFRDPVERFVSAYRSKCMHSDYYDGNYFCHQAFGSDNASFADAAAAMFDRRNWTDEDEMVNEHFKRQGSFCGGLHNTLQYYDTVEELKFDTAREKTSKLLRTIGADPAWIQDYDTLFPPPNAGLTHSNHTTHTKKHLKEYFPDDHPEVLSELFVYYEDDYRLFNLSRPKWQDEQLAKTLLMAEAVSSDEYEKEEAEEQKVFEEVEAIQSTPPATVQE